MDKKDSFSKGKARLGSTGKATRFNNGMKKCNLAASLTKAGIDKTAFESSRWN